MNLLDRFHDGTGQDLLLLLLLLDLLHQRSGHQLLRLTIDRRELTRFEGCQNDDLVLLVAAESLGRRYDHDLLLACLAGPAEGFRRSQHHDLLRVELLLLLVLLLGRFRSSDHKLLGRFDRGHGRGLRLRARWLRFQDRLSRGFGALLEQGLRDLNRLWAIGGRRRLLRGRGRNDLDLFDNDGRGGRR